MDRRPDAQVYRWTDDQTPGFTGRSWTETGRDATTRRGGTQLDRRPDAEVYSWTDDQTPGTRGSQLDRNRTRNSTAKGAKVERDVVFIDIPVRD